MNGIAGWLVRGPAFEPMGSGNALLEITAKQ
jgi:hypothetical protein